MKFYKPTTKSRRGMTGINYSQLLTGTKPTKSLVSGFKRRVGRNSDGKISVRHKGGGHKRSFRMVDFVLGKKEVPYKIISVEYDPNRTGFIGLAVFADGEKRYMLLPQKFGRDEQFMISANAPMKIGNRLPLKSLTVGTFIYNVELKPGDGAKLIRSAGCFAELVAKDGGYADLKMPSGEIRRVSEKVWASIGEVSNEENRLVNLGKAGRSRWLGIRPKVRGSAMNPVDHPYGGGEGRSGRGLRRAKTKWGKPSGIGQKTRTPKKYSNRSIVARRKPKRMQQG